MIQIESTKWDDEYFGIKSGKITFNKELERSEIEELKDKGRQFDCVVIKNLIQNVSNDRALASIPSNYLCDFQVQFSCRDIVVKREIEKEVTVQSNKTISMDILEIAKEVYKYSRFKEDPFLDSYKSQMIYVEWCKNAFKKPDKYFLTYEKEGEVKGYILFNCQKDITIELIGVNGKMQGEGIGNSMMSALKKYAWIQGYKKMYVGTQLMNKGAMQFYQKQGFELESVYTVYHYWPGQAER